MPILDYGAKPSFEPRGESKLQFFFGIENEVEVKPKKELNREADFVGSILGDLAITKHDGSLQEGFEICSVPGSLSFHKKAWSEFFAEGTMGLTTESPRCGMHVHINREPLSTLQIGKISSFVHKKFNSKFIEDIAQRPSGNYYDYTRERKLNDTRSGGHNCGVNLAGGNTIEIRIFKATLCLTDFLKNIEFCHALVKFTVPAKMSVPDSLNYEKFIEFVSKEKKIYSNLCNFLKQKGYIQ